MTVLKKKSDLVRLNVFLQESGVASRRKADEMIEARRISVNGKIIDVLGSKIDVLSKIAVDGKEIKNIPAKITYIFHKPANTITSRSDEEGRPIIFDLKGLKKLPQNVQAVGRLDFKTEGLLILTNDGDLSLALTHPRYSVEKTYNVLISTNIALEEIEKLRKGIELEDGIAKPLSVKTLSKQKLGNSQGVWLEIIVTEGRNRLVRRMLEALGLRVLRLVRIAIGYIRLPTNLEQGKIRPVTAVERKYLSDLKSNMEQEIKKNKKVAVMMNKSLKKKSTKRVRKEEYDRTKTGRSIDLGRKEKERKIEKENRIKKFQTKNSPL